MEKRKQADRPNKLSAQEKASLSAALSNLLRKADSSPEAAQEGLRTCLTLRRAVPAALLTTENIASTLSLDDLTRSLDRLSVSRISIDISAPLAAIRVLASKELSDRANYKGLSRTTKAVTSKLMKLAGRPISVKKGAATSSGGKRDSETSFTESTLSSATELALWILSRIFDKQSASLRSAYPLALRWVQAVESIWRRSLSPRAARSAAEFLRSLRRLLPPHVYAELMDEPSISDFVLDTDVALVREATSALLDARLRDLESILALVTKTDNARDRLLSELRDICQRDSSKLVPEAVEWVARQIEVGSSRPISPTAADESQSSALDYVAVCLLAAWDAASEGSRSERVLESIRRLARELFKVDLMGSPGEIVNYDERQHELKSQVTTAPVQVELIRPGVRWSDGIRSRFPVRAIAKPIT